MTGDFNPNHDPDDGRFTSGSGGGTGKKDISKMTEKEIIEEISKNNAAARAEMDNPNKKRTKEERAASLERSARTHELSKELDRRWAAGEKAHGIKGGFENAKSSGGTSTKMKNSPYFKKAARMSGLKPVLESMDKDSQDAVATAVARAAASPGGRDATIRFGRKSIKVTAPDKNPRVAKQYGLHWTGSKNTPTASYHGDSSDLATHLLITMKDLGYKGEKITLDAAPSAWKITEHMMVGDFNPNHDPESGQFTSGSGGAKSTPEKGERLGMSALTSAKIGTRIVTGSGKVYEKTDDPDLPWHNIEDRYGDKASSTYLAQYKEPGGAYAIKSDYHGKTGKIKYRDLEFEVNKNGDVVSGPKAFTEGLKNPKAPGEGLKQGEVVVYAPKYRSSGEEKYVSVILEERGGRYLIGSLNTNLSLGSTESVTGEMIQAIGYNAGVSDDWKKYNDPK